MSHLIKTTTLKVLLLTGILSTYSVPSFSQSFPSECDEACLVQMADDFLEAVAAADASLLAWNGYARFTLNGVELPFSELIWSTGGVAWNQYRIVVPDVESGQVAIITTMDLDAYPAMLSARIKIEWGRISEVEIIVNHQTDDPGFSDFTKLDTVDPLLMELVPSSQRMTREELITITDLYFDAIEGDSGDIAPFDEYCVRVENGAITAGAKNRMESPPASNATPGEFGSAGCKEQFDNGNFQYITEIDPRRYEVVDTSRGLVYGIFRFNSDATLSEMTLRDGSVVDAPVDYPVSTLLAELFKVVDGKLIRIEALGERVHYRAPTGWE